MKTKSKTILARELGISRSTLYYKSKQEEKDWKLKQQIEEVLREHPSYGSRRIRIALKRNRKPVTRVMQKYGIKAYRRQGKKWKKVKKTTQKYPNLLLTNYPTYPNHIWVSDFTHVDWKTKRVYISTIMDLFSRKIVGLEILTNHGVSLVINTLLDALGDNRSPVIFHSDNGSEYDASDFTEILLNLNVKISRSEVGCPWENGYQESYYGKFKIDLGDPVRFSSLGELIFNIYQTVHTYNTTRIHSALCMSPVQFLECYFSEKSV